MRKIKIDTDYVLNEELILDLIQKHSTEKARLNKLLRYYNNENDKITSREYKNQNKPQNRLSHPYCQYITNTAVGYFLGKPVTYSTEEWTNGEVVATLVPSETVTVTNNNGSFEYTFEENGTFTFEFVDKAGNEGTATATVTNIDKEAKGVTIKGMKYTLDNYTMTNDYPIGISNEFIGEVAEIAVEEGQLVLIVSWAVE